MIIGIFIALIIGIYCLGMGYLIYGWRKKTEVPTGKNVFISVIIPVRNEAANIEALLFDLQRQDYPTDQFEIIVVDDMSSDNTASLVEEVAQYAKVRIHLLPLRVEDNFLGSHKKRAISLAVKQCKGALIACTDGDCRVKRAWLATLAAHFEDGEKYFISGPVVFDPAFTFWKHLQKLEFLTLIGVGGASMKLGFPTMCNGANMAFKRSVFLEVNGYEGFNHVHSGDDEFLMHKIHRQFPERSSFIESNKAMVRTEPKENWQAFVNQRKRWAGKWKYHKGRSIKLLAVLIFLVNISLLMGLMTTISAYLHWSFFLPLIGAKLLVDFIFIWLVSRKFKERLSVFHFVCIEFLYPIYALYFGIISNVGGYQWKGRNLTNKSNDRP